jgi:hypothetical protein
MELSGQLHVPASLSPTKGCTDRLGGWVDPRAGLDAVEKKKIALPGLKPEPVARTIPIELSRPISVEDYSKTSIRTTWEEKKRV